MTDEYTARRQELGASAAVWSAAGQHRVGDGWWEALSGAPSVDYNVVVCHGGGGVAALTERVANLHPGGTPTIVMLAGGSLGDAQAAADSGWVCIGAIPFFVQPDLDGTADSAVRPLQGDEIGSGRAVVAQAFDLSEDVARTALPDDPGSIVPGARVWGLWEDGDLRACVLGVVVDGSLAIWSMATPPDQQSRGYGRRLLGAVLAASRDEGASRSILYASPAAADFYQGLGYRLLEHWQLWSRPRWVLGRS